MDIKELRELFKLVEKFDFNEVEIIEGDFKIRIEKGRVKAQIPELSERSLQKESVRLGKESNTESAFESPDMSQESFESPEDGEIITSPFVGTFYRSPSPEAPAFVEVGQQVEKGQALCIVEAMKLMNEIECETSGKIAQIYVENAQAVEFGEKLFRIVPA
ncbi:MAG: acetyl-CoA carboxylase biotin carboxyl carrier protein [Bdellovibrionales bacterium]|nr:acetyl-CoA carboxylase biotin carboxyl carrier protein [Bdellovibrionales bacterium]